MLTQFLFFWNPWLLPIVMLLVLALSVELPYRFGGKLIQRTVHDDAWNIAQAGLLTMTAFVAGLSFAQASERFTVRRALVMEEANAIGTTWLRADQLDLRAAIKFRKALTDYTANRIKAYESPDDPAFYPHAVEQSARDQSALWSIASPALRTHPGNLGLSLLMQALNDTIDVSTKQLQALTTHVPTVVFTLTLVLIWLAILSIGFRFARDQSRPALLAAVCIVAYTVLIGMAVDYDRPQTGFVTVNLNPLKAQLQVMQHSP